MLSRIWSFITPGQTLPPDQFKERLQSVIHAKHSYEDPDEYEDSMQELKALLSEAKKNRYTLNTHDRSGFTFFHHQIIRANPGNEDLCIPILELLIQNGCDTNIAGSDSHRSLPLTSACRRGMAHTVRWLLEHGANPLAHDTDVNGNPYQTPRQYIEKALAEHTKRNDHPKKEELIRRLTEIQSLLIEHEKKITARQNNYK